ncbi:MAG: DegT/DnrJ/EryC1/StrS family aminotransferase [Chryseolinea sp.]
MEQIPFNRLSPQHDASVDDALLSVVRDDWFILGKRVQTFETQFADFTGVKNCIGTGNGHDALVLALHGLGIGAGNPTSNDAAEVLVPANTCTATWLAISNAGCIPVPVEPDPDTLSIDPFAIEKSISSRTRAVMPVHLYGNPCDMGPIMALAQKHNLLVIEDNAQAHGATLRLKGSSQDQVTGSFGHANATSFYPTKNLGALGDGGAVTTNDDLVASRIRIARNYGYSSRDVCDMIGVNSRLDEMQASVLSVKLRRLQEWNQRRRLIASRYNQLLSGCGDLKLQKTTDGGTHVYHLYVIQTNHRDKLQKHLTSKGIQTMIHYPVPAHLQKAYQDLGYKQGSFPIAERASEQILSLPLWIGMSDDQILKVAEETKRFFGERL